MKSIFLLSSSLLVVAADLAHDGIGATQHESLPPMDGINDVSLIETQFGPDPFEGHDKMQLILSGKFMLASVIIAGDTVYGEFCDYNFDQQKKDPSLAPHFMDLYGESRHCQEHQVSFPLHTVASACRANDLKEGATMTSIEPTAFIFHQPKSGSTLLTNMIAVGHPNTRVISDSTALGVILDCQECDHDLKIKALQDTLYLLGRTTVDEHLYVKLSPSNTIGLSVVRDSFPDTKWIFVYRDADTILQKLMDSKVHRRICGTKKRRNPGKAISNYLSSQSKAVSSLQTDEQACAAFLATNMATVVEELGKDDAYGRLVQFEEELVSRKAIQNLLEYLEVTSPDWGRIDDQRSKRANSGQSELWEGEDEIKISHEVKSATSEFDLSSF